MCQEEATETREGVTMDGEQWRDWAGWALGGPGERAEAKSQALPGQLGGAGETGGGERDERTLGLALPQVSVPKKQRLEEVGDHQGHTASPGKGAGGTQVSPLLPGVLPL